MKVGGWTGSPLPLGPRPSDDPRPSSASGVGILRLVVCTLTPNHTQTSGPEGLAMLGKHPKMRDERCHLGAPRLPVSDGR